VGDLAGAGTHFVEAAKEIDERNELFPLLMLARGEAAYEAGRLGDARTALARSASHWSSSLPDIASVEARALLGFLDAMDGRVAEGARAVQASLAQATAMERFPIEARCRILLARIALRQKNYAEALRSLDAIAPDDGVRSIGAELRAQVLFWRAEALAGGKPNTQGADREAARKLLEGVRGALTETDKRTFTARPDINPIIN
jgi:hypothetical protein